MKTSLVFALVLRVAQTAAFFSQGGERLAATDPAPAPAPAPSAPSPATAVAALRVTFEIKNYNYYDLTKETCPETVEAAESSPGAGKSAGKKASKGDKEFPKLKPPDATEAIHEISSHTDKIGSDIKKGFDNMKAKDEPLPWMEKKGEKSASLLQSSACVIQHSNFGAIKTKSDKCETVMDVLRAAIKEVVGDVIKCTFHTHGLMSPAPAPSPAMVGAPAALVPLPPQPAAFLQSAPAPAPVIAPAAAEPDVSIFVTFSPGKERGHGRSIIVHITLTDTPGNGLDDVAMAKTLITHAVQNEVFLTEVKTALQIVTRIRPKLGKVAIQAKMVEQWDVKKCEGHVKGIVQQFSHHYTREQVPMALYNECTNFMTRLSFSHDHVLDRMDTIMCRETTARFAKHWNYGANAKDEDFQQMCVRACEAKFGKKAPQCGV